MSTEIDTLLGLLNRYGRGSDESGLDRIVEAGTKMRRSLNAVLAETLTARDPSGLVQVTVRLDTTLESVYISPHALRQLDAAHLGHACVTAIRAARERARLELADRVRDLSGAGPDEGTEADPAGYDRLGEQ